MLVDNEMTCRKVIDNATRQRLDRQTFYERKNHLNYITLILCLGHVEWEIENQNVVFKERRSLKFQGFCIC